jgi:hypothetical protein
VTTLWPKHPNRNPIRYVQPTTDDFATLSVTDPEEAKVTQNQTSIERKYSATSAISNQHSAIIGFIIILKSPASTSAPGSPRDPNLSPLGDSIYPPLQDPTLGNLGVSHGSGQS